MKHWYTDPNVDPKKKKLAQRYFAGEFKRKKGKPKGITEKGINMHDVMFHVAWTMKYRLQKKYGARKHGINAAVGKAFIVRGYSPSLAKTVVDHLRNGRHKPL